MRILAIAATIALLAQPQPPQPLTFPQPATEPDTIGDREDFPFLPPLEGARLIQSSSVSGPLELKSATADDEAVLAGMSYTKKSYERTAAISSTRFISSYRDALFAAGWKLIDVTKLDEKSSAPETVTVSAHYMSNGRNIYARVTHGAGRPVRDQRRRRRRGELGGNAREGLPHPRSRACTSISIARRCATSSRSQRSRSSPIC